MTTPASPSPFHASTSQQQRSKSALARPVVVVGVLVATIFAATFRTHAEPTGGRDLAHEIPAAHADIAASADVIDDPVFLPLAASRAIMADLPAAATAAPTPIPSDTSTPEPTATPTVTPTPTEVACPPIPQRVSVNAIDVAPATVKVSANRGRTTFAVYLAPIADGGAKIAWEAANGEVHVTTVDAEDARQGDDVVLKGDEVGGLVAHDDGGTALVVVAGSVLSLVRLDKAGAVEWKKDLIGTKPQSATGSKCGGQLGARVAPAFGPTTSTACTPVIPRTLAPPASTRRT